jgi:hypothetical protein
MPDTGLITFSTLMAAPATNSGHIVFLPLIADPATTSTAPGAASAVPAPTLGWIVFLPLVGAILGAVIGAWANYKYREQEAKKAEECERDGLMRLIAAEVIVNRGVFDQLQSKGRADIASNLSTAI